MQIGFGLRNFGGEEYIPRILALSAVRVLGARIALGATCVGIAVSLREVDKRLALPVVLAVPALTGVATLFILLAAWVAFAIGFPRAESFLGSALATLEPADVAAGFSQGLAYGVALALCIPAGFKILRRYENGFGRGFLAYLLSWVVALPVSIVLDLVFSS